MSDLRDFTGKNRRFTGTDSIKNPIGTTGQRVASGSSDKGKIRFNSTTNLMEYYDGTDWKAIDAPPVVTGFTVDDVGGTAVTSATIDNEKNIFCGGICIPSRKKESKNLVKKSECGAEFFTTQVLCDSVNIIKMIENYQKRCNDKKYNAFSNFVNSNSFFLFNI